MMLGRGNEKSDLPFPFFLFCALIGHASIKWNCKVEEWRRTTGGIFVETQTGR